MKMTKKQLINKLYELNKEEINKEMRLAKIKSGSKEAIEAVYRHGHREKVISWVEDYL